MTRICANCGDWHYRGKPVGYCAAKRKNSGKMETCLSFRPRVCEKKEETSRG